MALTHWDCVTHLSRSFVHLQVHKLPHSMEVLHHKHWQLYLLETYQQRTFGTLNDLIEIIDTAGNLQVPTTFLSIKMTI